MAIMILLTLVGVPMGLILSIVLLVKTGSKRYFATLLIFSLAGVGVVLNGYLVTQGLPITSPFWDIVALPLLILGYGVIAQPTFAKSR